MGPDKKTKKQKKTKTPFKHTVNIHNRQLVQHYTKQLQVAFGVSAYDVLISSNGMVDFNFKVTESESHELKYCCTSAISTSNFISSQQ